MSGNSAAAELIGVTAPARSNKFSCCAPHCIACWICSIFWPVTIGVVMIIVGTTYIPTAAQTAIDGSRLYIVDGDMETSGEMDPNTGIQAMTFNATLRMVNPMPVGCKLPGGPATMGVNDAWSYFPPQPDIANLSMPVHDTTAGSQTFPYNTMQYMNMSNPWTLAFAVGLTMSTVFPDCDGCAKTSPMRPEPLTLSAAFAVSFGPFSVDIDMKKDSICHCIVGYPGTAIPCTPLEFTAPYGRKYTPCADPSKGGPQCQVPAAFSVDEAKSMLGLHSSSGAGLGIKGFHCAPRDDVFF